MKADTKYTYRDHGTGRRQLSEEVASFVRELIISGEVRPGTFLRLEPIAEAVGVSNTPVREGLLMLRSEGFVRLVPRRGFMVAPFTKQDISDIFWTQAKLAGELCARAASRITDEHLTQTQNNLALYAVAIEEGDTDAVAELGHEFHRVVNKAADSHRLALLLESIVRQLPDSFYAAIEGQVAASRDEHPAIAEALTERRGGKARKLMEQHMLDRGEHLIQMLEHRNVWDFEPWKIEPVVSKFQARGAARL